MSESIYQQVLSLAIRSSANPQDQQLVTLIAGEGNTETGSPLRTSEGDDTNNNVNGNNNNNNNNENVQAQTLTQADVINFVQRLKLTLPFVLLLLAKILFDYFSRILFTTIAAVLSIRLEGQFKATQVRNGTSRGLGLIKLFFCSLAMVMYLITGLEVYSLTFGSTGGSIASRLALEEVVIGNDKNNQTNNTQFPTPPPSLGFLDILWLLVTLDLTVHLMAQTLKILVFFVFWLRSTPLSVAGVTSKCLNNSTNGLCGGAFNARRWRRWARARGLAHHQVGSSSPSSSPSMASGGGTNHHHGDVENLLNTSEDDNDKEKDKDSTGSPCRSPSGGLASASSVSREEMTNQVLLKKITLVIALISLTYRTMIPIPVWGYYFRQGGGRLLPSLYGILKRVDLSYKIFGLHASLAHLFLGTLEFGHYSEPAELQGIDSCAVCFDDPFKPITLPCNHIFCEVCILEWCERERTCPVCRQEVKSNNTVLRQLREDGHLERPVII